MRYFFITITLLLALTAVSAKKAADEYKIMTCNIRITGLEADAPYAERVWENRRDLCVNTILKRKPDFFCLQEVIYDSYAYFKEKCKKYTSYGFAGPEMDPYTEGYHFIGKNVIFFRTDKFEFVGSGCYWLSEDPLISGSMSWETNRARHCNWVRLRDKKTGKEFRILDIHLDHISDAARREQIKIIVRECEQYSKDFPQILCGDFNAGIKRMVGKKCMKTYTAWANMAIRVTPFSVPTTSQRATAASTSSSTEAMSRLYLVMSSQTTSATCIPVTTIS